MGSTNFLYIYCGNMLDARLHCFANCLATKSRYKAMEAILETLLGYHVKEVEIVHLSFNHRNKQKLRTAIWFCVKYMFQIFSNRDEGLAQSLAKIGRETGWMIRIGK